jgi:hypothetical protein
VQGPDGERHTDDRVILPDTFVISR